MLNKNAQTWVDTLRAGIYKQGKGYLKVEDTYCCLGVACELAIKDGIPVNVKTGTNSNGNNITYFCGEKFYLPEVVRNWLGLKDKTGNWTHGQNVDANVAHMNDEERKSFTEIATFVEQNADKLFTASAG